MSNHSVSRGTNYCASATHVRILAIYRCHVGTSDYSILLLLVISDTFSTNHRLYVHIRFGRNFPTARDHTHHGGSTICIQAPNVAVSLCEYYYLLSIDHAKYTCTCWYGLYPPLPYITFWRAIWCFNERTHVSHYDIWISESVFLYGFIDSLMFTNSDFGLNIYTYISCGTVRAACYQMHVPCPQRRHRDAISCMYILCIFLVYFIV